jgi:hypothetical protein
MKTDLPFIRFYEKLYRTDKIKKGSAAYKRMAILRRTTIDQKKVKKFLNKIETNKDK